jgi:hypothetical protein
VRRAKTARRHILIIQTDGALPTQSGSNRETFKPCCCALPPAAAFATLSGTIYSSGESRLDGFSWCLAGSKIAPKLPSTMKAGASRTVTARGSQKFPRTSN